jgi:hypothetical protein
MHPSLYNEYILIKKILHAKEPDFVGLEFWATTGYSPTAQRPSPLTHSSDCTLFLLCIAAICASFLLGHALNNSYSTMPITILLWRGPNFGKLTCSWGTSTRWFVSLCLVALLWVVCNSGFFFGPLIDPTLRFLIPFLQFSDTNLVSNNSIHFWHYLPELVPDNTAPTSDVTSKS